MNLRLALCLLASAGFATAQSLEAPLDAWLARQESIRSMDVEFVQERRLPALKQPTTTTGRLSFSKPSLFRWQLGEPAETLVVSDGTTVTLIEAAARTARVVSADSPRAARFAALSDKAFQNREAFHQAFEVVESRVSSGIHQFTLRPRDRRFRSNVPWIFLDIDPATAELRAMEMELQDKSRLRSIFRTPVFNKELPASLFRPDLSGYKIQ
jgi:outer membrane lipoprotein carrier protein